MNLLRRLSVGLALACTTAVVAAGCGGETTDVSGGVNDLNKQLKDAGTAATLSCPKEVDGGEGTNFDCTLKADDGSAEEKVGLKVQKEGDNLVVGPQDQAKFDAAVAKVSGQ